jgi:alpha-tubulin suppressor-like RCC1 family protein
VRIAPTVVIDSYYFQVKQIACGGYFSFMLTSSLQLYGFGEIAYLGIDLKSPVFVPLLAGDTKSIAAGAGFTMAIKNSGQLYSFGTNNVRETTNSIVVWSTRIG